MSHHALVFGNLQFALCPCSSSKPAFVFALLPVILSGGPPFSVTHTPPGCDPSWMCSWHLCGPQACLLIALCTEYMMPSPGHLSFPLPSVTYTTAWCHPTPGYSRPLPFRLYCARTQKHAYLLDKNRQKQNKSSPMLTEASSLGFYTEKGLGCADHSWS